MKLRALVVVIVVLMAIALAACWICAPYAGFQGQVFVDIPKGAGPGQIARMLANAGVLWNRWQFLDVRLLRPRARLKAGEYLFKKPASPWEVFDRIARGDIFYYVLPVPEGNSTFDIAASLERQGIVSSQEFLRAAHDPSLIRDLDPKAPTLEGYLFPDTYHVTRHATPAQLCRQMTERFRKAWQQLGSPKKDVHETVVLASMVEKEAKLPQERPLIASVFLNRLRIGMPLQCDPTAIYAALLEDRYRGAIYRSDLERKQLYNTYQYRGLPPGPIANPGLESLRAAIEPAQTGYLYFVVRPDGSGAHQFSKELAQHARAVQEYKRELETAERQADGPRGLPRANAPGRNHGSDLGGSLRAPGAGH